MLHGLFFRTLPGYFIASLIIFLLVCAIYLLWDIFILGHWDLKFGNQWGNFFLYMQIVSMIAFPIIAGCSLFLRMRCRKQLK